MLTKREVAARRASVYPEGEDAGLSALGSGSGSGSGSGLGLCVCQGEMYLSCGCESIRYVSVGCVYVRDV